ncbi:MAG: hypothetical protein LBE82_10775, partial [Chitinophagaceae bacterium]|nr:hypothetical protein [Chitinophagaceae bacterium]
KNSLDEWIYYLKTNKIKDEFTAQGLDKAREVLAYDNLSDEEKRAYKHRIEVRRDRDAEARTKYREGREEGIAEGLAKGLKNTVINSCKANLAMETISSITGLTVEEIMKILENEKLL